jgi:transposase
MTVELQRITRLFEKFFHKSSERLADDKASKAANETPDNATPEPPQGKRGKKGDGGRNPLPPELPRIEQIVEHEIPVCDCCGTPFKCIGEECSEQLHFKPMELFVVVQILMKYIAACKCSEKRSETVESPIKADDKGIASNSLIAAIAVQKYMDHLPLARQSKQLFKRCGVILPESSMSRWMGLAATICLPLDELIRRLLLGSVYIQMDATGAKYLDPLIKGKAGTGTIWGYNGDATRPYALYDFQTNGKRDGPAKFLQGYTGYVQCDASTVNHGLFVAGDDAPPVVPATEFGCWSHCRRNFFEARGIQPASKEMLEMIKRFFTVSNVPQKKCCPTNGKCCAEKNPSRKLT